MTAHDAARAALDAGDWQTARQHLEASIASGETAEALEDLGLAGWWLDDATLTFGARERAYKLYRDRDDARGAARVAIWLVWDNLAFRGDGAVASGWLERARRLLADHQRSAEFGWLLIREGEVALFRGHDPAAAIEAAVKATRLGRGIGDQSVEFTALALEGLARVSTGDVRDGMRCLDEATVAATSGEVRQLHAVGLVCCWQIFACERVRDYDRAAQWCARVAEFSRRWGLHPLSSTCRIQYAGVLVWRGDWERAEKELSLAATELERIRPASIGPALARLGELRLRQGRWDDAERLFHQSPSQPQSRLGLAMLMLERGNPTESAEIAADFLSHLGDDEATAKVAALEILVKANTRTNASVAERHLKELERIGAVLGTDPVLASVAAARGTLVRHQGDNASAMRCLELAVELFEKSGAPYETARSRLDLAESLVDLSRIEAARQQATAALEAFTKLDCPAGIELARTLLGRLEPQRARRNALTARQIEILRFVAQGMSNGQIAGRLNLSEHTVKRHVANLLQRLGVPSRAAAAAYAAREGIL